MKMEGAPQKNPNKTLEAIKKAARILAVGSTLASTTSAEAKEVRVQKNTPNTIVNTGFAILHGDDPDYVIRPAYDKFRRSKNVEDMRDVAKPYTELYGIQGISIDNSGVQENTHIVKRSSKGNTLKKEAVGPYDRDIEDTTKHIQKEVAAEKAAKEKAGPDSRVLFDETPLDY